MCGDGMCIDKTLQCNRHYDCQDGTDETECEYFKKDMERRKKLENQSENNTHRNGNHIEDEEEEEDEYSKNDEEVPTDEQLDRRDEEEQDVDEQHRKEDEEERNRRLEIESRRMRVDDELDEPQRERLFIQLGFLVHNPSFSSTSINQHCAQSLHSKGQLVDVDDLISLNNQNSAKEEYIE
ncbi:hypothetical protein DICVIV_06661 [Dictyocaulus viviparus]|uniref:Low-density lipoprotein receptor domain class A n=1 Tax=Dictyocaulus viviparus TaxID=29172 RepID=A0A0D8XRX6_DICVI|nr:hypothetical protein DICVIV_06661 [Dictyocaulus viviparus]